jgi:hypothetical protein
VLLGVDRASAVVVKECEEGTLVFGDYATARVTALHGNLASLAGTPTRFNLRDQRVLQRKCGR